MQNIGALQESLTVGSNQQTLKARLKRWVFNRFLKSTESETARVSSGRAFHTARQGQREKRRALHILSVSAASRSSLLKKIVGRRVNDKSHHSSSIHVSRMLKPRNIREYLRWSKLCRYRYRYLLTLLRLESRITRYEQKCLKATNTQ